MTLRLDLEIASRVGVIAQVLHLSRNELICQAITESVRTYEDNPEYQKKREEWIENLANVGA
jgi:predicted transcriptional regulator